MGRHKYVVHLTDDQRQHLRHLTRVGRAPTREITHARILLKADAGLSDATIAEQLDISAHTVLRVRRRFVQETLDAALKHRTPRAFKPRKLDGRLEAHLIALASSDPPEERSQWSLRLLANHLVQLGEFDSISPETVRQTLKKTRCTLT